MAANPTTLTLDYTTAAVAPYDAFSVSWDGRSDQSLSITWTGLDNTGGEGISLRLAHPRTGTAAMTLTDGTDLSTTSANPAVTTTSSDVAYSDLPADGTYMVEFLLHPAGDTTAAGSQVIARGRITVQHSTWENS